MGHRYKTWCGPMPTTAAISGITTGTTIKTLLQIATPSTRMLEVIAWGYTCNTVPNGAIELLSGDVADTVTAHVAAGVQPLDGLSGYPASLVTLGTAATGYNATAQGTMTAVRVHDVQIPVGTQPSDLSYEYQFMPDERPRIAPSHFLKVRISPANATGILCWVAWEE
jgi:hypothetical protein